MYSSSCWYGGSGSDATLQEVLKPLQLEQSVQMCNIYDVCQVAIERCAYSISGLPCCGTNAIIKASERSHGTGTHCILNSTVNKLKAKLEPLTLEKRTVYISQQMAANAQWRDVSRVMAAVSDWTSHSSELCRLSLPSSYTWTSEARRESMSSLRYGKGDTTGQE